MLRLKLRHSLGEQAISLAQERGDNRPIVFGRERGVDVVVASMRVAPRHCAIFYHRASGRWVLQDGNTRGGTALNGVPLPDGRRAWALQASDAITLGDDPNPVTLTIEAIEHRPKDSSPQRGGAPSLAARDASEWSGQHDLEGLARVARSRGREARPRSTWPSVLLAMLAAVAVAGAAFAGWWLWLRPDTATSSPLTTAAKPANPIVTSRPLQDDVMGGRSLPPMPDVGSAGPMLQRPDEPLGDSIPPPVPAADPAGMTGILAGISPQDPLRARAEWAAVVRARNEGALPARIQEYQQYLALPEAITGPLGDVVAAWLDEELDALWWLRITELFAQERALTRRAAELQLELRSGQETEALLAELAEIHRQLAAVSYALSRTMGYTEALAPDRTDADALDRLRRERDPDRFEVWRREVLRETLSSGRLPWEVAS